MSSSNLLDIIGESYDLGDVIAGMVGGFGITSLTGIASSSAYGVSFQDAAFSLGGEAVSFAAFSVILATLVSFITNDGLTVQSLLNRPAWEKACVGALVAAPLLVTTNLFGIHDVILSNYVNGTLAALVLVVGFILVGFRKGNSAKKGMFERVKP